MARIKSMSIEKQKNFPCAYFVAIRAIDNLSLPILKQNSQMERL